jgi:hypothetical protein
MREAELTNPDHDSLRAADRVPDGPMWRSAVPSGRTEFFGDDNRFLKDIQNDSYPFLVHELFDAARKRYFDACALVGVETELAKVVLPIARFSRPFLRRAYSRIAAFYRFAFVAGPQLPLPFDKLSYDIRQRMAWEEFYRREIKRLATDNHFTVAILLGAGYWNSSQGKAGEANLVDMLDHRYGRFTLERRSELLRLDIDPEEILDWQFVGSEDWDHILGDIRGRGLASPDPDTAPATPKARED